MTGRLEGPRFLSETECMRLESRVDLIVQELAGLYGRDFLTLRDYAPAEIEGLLELAAALKQERRRGRLRQDLAGKTVALLFFKPSTRTRVSFEVAARELGASSLYLSAQEMQMSRGESVEDTARVLARYVHAVVIRTFAQEQIERFAQWSSVPVINALTDLYHPAQVLADLLTLKERFGTLKGLRLAYVGDGNNVAHSLMIGGAKMGMDVVVSTPEAYRPDPEVFAAAAAIAEETGGSVRYEPDPYRAVKGAKAVYTDTWVSMGQEAEREQKLRAFSGYQVDSRLVAAAAPGAVVMHDLPAKKGEEIAYDVFEGPQSVIFDQAENRLHAQKALLLALLREPRH